MAKNTTLKTRIQNRHDTEANWTTASNATKPFIPLKGEVIVYDPDTTHTTPRVKIGDGTTKVGDLAFVAGDISKYVTLDTEQTISGIKTFTNAMIVDSGEGIHFSGAGEKAGLPAIIRLRTTGNSASLDPTAYDVVFQNKAGTIALTSDIPNVSKYVTLDTAQTIDGVKTFSKYTHFNAGVETVGDGYLRGELTVSKDAKSGADATGNGRVKILNSGGVQCTKNTGSLWTQVELYDKAINFTSRDYPFATANTYDKVLRITPNLPTKAESDTFQDLTLNIPFKEGTLATLDDIPDPITNYVTTDTEQTISGVKTFTEGLRVDSIKTTNNVVLLSTNSIATQLSNSSRRLVLCGNEARPKYSLNSGGTSTEIALLSDIPTIDSTTLTGLMTGSNGIIVADKDSKVDISFTNSPAFYNQTEEAGYVAINEAYAGRSPQLRVCANGGADYAIVFPDRYSIYVGDIEASIYGAYDDTDNSTYLYINSAGSLLGRILTTKDLDTASTKVKDTFVASSWSTSSATTDTQFGKYYKDVTIPNKNIINVRCVSTKGMSGITLDYAPEIKCNNRRTSDTNLRIYSNNQLEGAVIITLVGDTLPNKFSKTNATLSTSSWTASSATVDTQFATYYTDVTVPAGDVMNIRILSNEDVTGISTAAYYPEVWSDNRKINSTTLRIYSNKQVAGSVTILTMEV